MTALYLEEAVNLPEPQLVVREKVDPRLAVDIQQIAQTMQELGISSEGIARTTIEIEAKPHLAVLGSATPKVLHRLRHGRRDVNDGPGSLVRLSTFYQGKQRTPEQINHTLVHELEHVAQIERRDPKLLGQLSILGGMAVGAAIGNKLGKRSGNRFAQIAATLFGAAAGHSLGYRYGAPAEHQARLRAEQVSTTAVTKK